MARISASILSFYFEAKKNKISESAMINNINKALDAKKDIIDILHFDIEDGLFVKHKSFSPSQLRKIKFAKKKEAHLMVVNYKKYLKDYLSIADMFIFHSEVIKRDFEQTIQLLKQKRKFVGISINPDTHVDEMKYLDKINLVLVMSVYPGKPGQTFIETSLRKVRKLAEIRKKRKLNFAIEIDGGIKKENAKKCIDAGADILVIGTGLFNQV